MVRRTFLHRWSTPAALAMVAMLSVSCAVQQDLIDRTENNSLKKALFTGEWYYQQTVVDVPGTLTVTFPGMTNYSGMHRVRWDIQKEWLYARKSYEHVEGAKNIDTDSGEFKGAIVGAWRIQGHFDIKRSYNPTTGEESNVITENSADQKWFESTHFRVDWSTNHATEFMFLDANEDIVKEGVPFYFEEDSDPRFKPVFDDGAGYVDFVTAMAVQPGKVHFRQWNVSYPICWMYYHENADCNTEIIKIRNSFMKRHYNRDYEPRLHMGVQSEWFGFFVQDRMKWESHYGITQKAREKIINRHNIWVRHHFDDIACTTDQDCADPHGATSRCDKMVAFHTNDLETDTDADGLPDAYEDAVGLDANSADSDGNDIVDQYDDGNGNAKIDLWDYYQWVSENKVYRCTIPMAEREPKPIAYFNPGEFPRDLICDKDDTGTGACNKWNWSADKNEHETKWSAVHHVSNNYDEAWWRIFLMGGYGWKVDRLKLWLDSRDPENGNFTEDEKATLYKFGNKEEGFHAFTICPNNPVQDTDAWPCRFNHKSFKEAKALMSEGKDTAAHRPTVRHGDIRFSMIHYVKDYYGGYGLLGLGPSHTDPLTGENLAGVANVYALNDWAATYIQEMVQLLNGSISADDYVDGLNLQSWIDNLNSKTESQATNTGKSYSTQDLKDIYGSLSQPWMKKIQKQADPKMFDSMKDSKGNLLSNRQLKRVLLSNAQKHGLFDPSRFTGGLSAIKGSSLERQMIDEEILWAAGIPAGIPGYPAVSLDDDNTMDKASIARNGGFVAFQEAQEQFKFDMANRNNAYFLEMADDALVGIAHRLKDMNTEQIWLKARDIIMRAVLEHEMGHTVGLHHNWGGSEDVLNFHPEYWQVRTNNFQDTGFCDADAKTGLCPFYVKPMNDFQLGRDAKNSELGVKSLYEYAYSSVMDYAGRYIIDGNGLGRYDIAAMMYGHVDKVEVYEDVGSVPADNFQEWYDTAGAPLMLYGSGPQSFHYTTWYPQMGSKIYDENNRKLVPYTDIKPDIDQFGRPGGYFYTEGNKKMPRIPYVFCTYTRGDISDGCNTRDTGSDQYERMKQHIDTWETWYPMRSFTRYQYGKSPSGYFSRNLRRTYRRLKDYNNTYALYQGLFRQYYNETQIDKFFTDAVNGWGAYTVAMQDAFNMAMRTLTMPDIKGFKAKAPAPDGSEFHTEAVWSNEGLFDTDLVNGRFFATSWYTSDYQNEFGLHWHEGLHHIGFYLDKIMSLLVLTNAQTYFVARDTAEDIRKWRISFFDNYTEQLIDFFGDMLSENYSAIAPVYDGSQPRDTTVTDSDGVRWVNQIAQRNYAVPSKSVKLTGNRGAVEPATRFTLQIYASVLGTLLFHNNFDNSYAERAMMWKDGDDIGVSITPTFEANGTPIIVGTLSYVDPLSGQTFVGADYNDKRGISQKMINHANTLKSRSSYCNTDSGKADSCATGMTTETRAAADNAMKLYNDLLNVSVKVSRFYQFQANWSWNPTDP